MKRVITSLVALIVAGLVVAGAVALVKHKKAILASAPRNSVGALPVHTVVAEQGDLTVTQRYIAIVKPVREADIAARVMARIEEVRCDEGDRVAKGDVLVVLDDKELRQGVQAVKAQVAQAQAELEANKADIKALVRVTYRPPRPKPRPTGPARPKANSTLLRTNRGPSGNS